MIKTLYESVHLFTDACVNVRCAICCLKRHAITHVNYNIRSAVLCSHYHYYYHLQHFFITINFLPHISALERRLISGFRLSGAERSENQEHIETHLSSQANHRWKESRKLELIISTTTTKIS